MPAHVARRHCLAGSIDEPERRPLGRSIALGFLIAGWRTRRELNPHPLSRTRERDLAGHTSFDSFPDGLPAGESGPGGELMSSLSFHTLGNRRPIPS